MRRSAVHEHGLDERLETLRPRSAQSIEQQGVLGAAAAAGRPEVLGAQGVLGLQRSVGNAGVATLMEEEQSPVHDVISSGGRPLDTDVRTDMESRLGHDFSDVRVHDDTRAADSAAAVNAHAYTVGSNIVFRDLDTSSTQGRTTLAHELTHVVQQRSGPVDGTSAPGGIKVSDPGDRFETEAAANADRVMSAPAPVPASAEVAASGPALQRQAAEDEEAVQGLFVQREAEEEQEEPVQGLFLQRETAEDQEDEATS